MIGGRDKLNEQPRYDVEGLIMGEDGTVRAWEEVRQVRMEEARVGAACIVERGEVYVLFGQGARTVEVLDAANIARGFKCLKGVAQMGEIEIVNALPLRFGGTEGDMQIVGGVNCHKGPMKSRQKGASVKTSEIAVFRFKPDLTSLTFTLEKLKVITEGFKANINSLSLDSFPPNLHHLMVTDPKDSSVTVMNSYCTRFKLTQAEDKKTVSIMQIGQTNIKYK